jgi:uncharacterized protein YcaQ
MTVVLSALEARRIAVAAQGFGTRPARPSITHLRKLAARVHAFQIDSVNVLVRAHYVPAFARLGPYDVAALDTLAYRKHELFEYWGHAACLMPVSLFPLLRYRMHQEDALEYVRSEPGSYLAKVYAEVEERGPLAAGELADPGQRSGNWWGWGRGKTALEYLFNSGLLSIAGRRRFERLYDLTERVIPAPVLEIPSPGREESMKQLMCLAARACGVGGFRDISSYFNVDASYDRRPSRPHGEPRPPLIEAVAKRLVAELVEEGRLLPAQVEGWSGPAYVPPGIKAAPPGRARAVVTPFDSLVWERSRVKRLFGMSYSIEVYLPAPKRVYGYYVCPFLLGDTLVARCDLKADRERATLMVRSAFLEPGHDAARVGPELADELRSMQAWLGLDRIEVDERGDLAPGLRRCLRSSRDTPSL